jgi:hypothetical protein
VGIGGRYIDAQAGQADLPHVLNAIIARTVLLGEVEEAVVDGHELPELGRPADREQTVRQERVGTPTRSVVDECGWADC